MKWIVPLLLLVGVSPVQSQTTGEECNTLLWSHAQEMRRVLGESPSSREVELQEQFLGALVVLAERELEDPDAWTIADNAALNAASGAAAEMAAYAWDLGALLAMKTIIRDGIPDICKSTHGE